MEPLQAMRMTLLSVLELDQEIKTDHTLWFSGLARKAKQYSLASMLIHSITAPMVQPQSPLSHQSLGSAASNNLVMSRGALESLYEEAKVLWKQKEPDSALNISRFLVQTIQGMGRELKELQAKTLCQMGKWLSQTKTESSQSISEYLQESVSISEKFKTRGVERHYYTLAKCLFPFFVLYFFFRIIMNLKSTL